MLNLCALTNCDFITFKLPDFQHVYLILPVKFESSPLDWLTMQRAACMPVGKVSVDVVIVRTFLFHAIIVFLFTWVKTAKSVLSDNHTLHHINSLCWRQYIRCCCSSHTPNLKEQHPQDIDEYGNTHQVTPSSLYARNNGTHDNSTFRCCVSLNHRYLFFVSTMAVNSSSAGWNRKGDEGVGDDVGCDDM